MWLQLYMSVTVEFTSPDPLLLGKLRAPTWHNFSPAVFLLHFPLCGKERAFIWGFVVWYRHSVPAWCLECRGGSSFFGVSSTSAEPECKETSLSLWWLGKAKDPSGCSIPALWEWLCWAAGRKGHGEIRTAPTQLHQPLWSSFSHCQQLLLEHKELSETGEIFSLHGMIQGRGMGSRWSLRSLPTLFYDSIISHFPDNAGSYFNLLKNIFKFFGGHTEIRVVSQTVMELCWGWSSWNDGGKSMAVTFLETFRPTFTALFRKVQVWLIQYFHGFWTIVGLKCLILFLAWSKQISGSSSWIGVKFSTFPLSSESLSCFLKMQRVINILPHYLWPFLHNLTWHSPGQEMMSQKGIFIGWRSPQVWYTQWTCKFAW